jgi:hypothetical protein
MDTQAFPKGCQQILHPSMSFETVHFVSLVSHRDICTWSSSFPSVLRVIGREHCERKTGMFILTRHRVSLLGLALVATALISLLFVLPQWIRGYVDNPYIGIVVFLILPIIFFSLRDWRLSRTGFT